MKFIGPLIVVLSFAPCVARSQSPPAPVSGQPEAVAPGPPQGAAPQASPPPRLSVAEVESMALANHPGLARAAAQVQAAHAQWLQVGLYPNPTGGYRADEIGDDGKSGMQGAFISQEFVTGHKLALSREVACREVQQAEQELAAERFRVVNDVRIAFHDALLAQRTIDVAGRLLKANEEGQHIAEALVRGKESSRIDLLQAQIESESARIALRKAQQHHDAAWRRLSAAAGMPQLAPAPLAGNPDERPAEITWDAALHRLLMESPELAAAHAAVDRASASICREEAETRPNVTVAVALQHDNATSDNIAGVEVGVPLPLFNRNQGNIRKAQAELAAAQADVSRVELDLQTRLADVFERYANARQQVDAYSGSILPNAGQSMEMVTKAYRQGEQNYLAVLIAERTFFHANMEYLDALRELGEAAVTIDGFLLTGGLQPAK